MVRNFLLGVIFPYLFSVVALAQTHDSLVAVNVKHKENEDSVYSRVKQRPEFPGGKVELDKFLFTNTKYPDIVKNKNVKGVVVIRFVVDKKGKIRNPTIAKRLGVAFDKEALRVIQKMPSWIPGSDGKKPVNTFVNLSVLFPPELRSQQKIVPKIEVTQDSNSATKPKNKTEFASESKMEADSAFFKLGIEQMKKLDYNSAIFSFSETLKINPDNATALLLRGTAYYKIKNLDNACNDWGRSVELGNKNAVNMIRNYCKR